MVHKFEDKTSRCDLVLSQIRVLMGTLGLNKDIYKECNRLLMSGGIDTSDVSATDYSKAKIVLAVAMKKVAKNMTPLSKDGREDMRNLEKM